MILPYWVSLGLMVLAIVVMLSGGTVWKNDDKLRLLPQAAGAVLVSLSILSSGLRGFERSRLRLSEAVTTLGKSGVSDQARAEAIESAGWNLSDLREDSLFLGAGFLFLGIAVSLLGTTIQKLFNKTDATQTGTSA